KAGTPNRRYMESSLFPPDLLRAHEPPRNASFICKDLRVRFMGRAWSLIPRHRPRRVGIVCRHRFGDLRRILPEVLLINAALLVDDEGHHAGLAVFGGPGHQREATDHVSIDYVIIFAARRVIALSG